MHDHIAVAKSAQFNNCHVLTVSQDWYENGKAHWRLLAGTECNGGFVKAQFATRKETIEFALKVASSEDYGFILAWQNGWRNFHWIDVPHYKRTKERRAVTKRG